MCATLKIVVHTVFRILRFIWEKLTKRRMAMKNLAHENYFHKRHDSLCLNGEWDFSCVDRGSKEQPDFAYRCNLPASVYECVYQAGIEPNPYFSANSNLYTWIDKKSWFFRRKFYLQQDLRKDVAVLCLDGCGYYSKICVNGKWIGKHEGLFGGPYVNIFSHLKFGCENEIIIQVDAPKTEGKAKRKSDFKQFSEIMPWNINNHHWATRNGEWVVFGIWKDVRIEFCYYDRLGRPFIYTESISKNKATLQFECDIVDKQTQEFKSGCHHIVGAQCMTFDRAFPGKLYNSGLKIRLCVTAQDSGVVVFEKNEDIEKFKRYTCPHDNNKISEYLYTLKFDIKNPRLWWVNGMGEQPLYQARVELLFGDKAIDSIQFDFGIRTISQTYTSAKKRSNPREKYLFSINGKKFFVKGMNLMQDNMLYRLDKEKLARQIFLLKKAGIQLVRIWNGGNQFESEDFYKLCNENGILVWQDLLLANCANADKWDMGVVHNQIALNVQRIRNHPSLAVYCGGNEFNEHIKKTAHVQQESRMTLQECDWTRKYYVTTSYGESAHVYNTYEPTWFYKNWKELDFMSECGWASFPNYKNFRKCFAEKEKLDLMRLTESVANDKNAFSDFPELQHRITEFEGNLGKLLLFASNMTNVWNATIEEIFECANIPVMNQYAFLCEAMRGQFPATGGLMPWVFNRMIMTLTGCQCVDADGEPLPAYYAIQRGYKKNIFALQLDRLIYLPQEKVELKGFILNETKEVFDGKVELFIYDTCGQELAYRSREIVTNSYKKNVEFKDFIIPETLQNEYFFIVAKMQNGENVFWNTYFLRTDEMLKNKEFKNRYLNEGLALQEYCSFDNKIYLKNQLAKVKALISCDVEDTKKEQGKIEVTLTIQSNRFVFPCRIQTDENSILYAEDNYFGLLPNEIRKIKLVLFTAHQSAKIKIGGWNTDWVEINI